MHTMSFGIERPRFPNTARTVSFDASNNLAYPYDSSRRSRFSYKGLALFALRITGTIGALHGVSDIYQSISNRLSPSTGQTSIFGAQPSAQIITQADTVYPAQILDTNPVAAQVNIHNLATSPVTKDSLRPPIISKFDAKSVDGSNTQTFQYSIKGKHIAVHPKSESINTPVENRYFIGDPHKYVAQGIEVPDDLTYTPNPNFDLLHPLSASIQAIRSYVYGINPDLAVERYPTGYGTKVDLVRYIVDACVANPLVINNKKMYIDPTLIFAMAGHESDMGKIGEAVLTKSLGNQRPLSGEPYLSTGDGNYRNYAKNTLGWAASGDEMISLIKYIIKNYNAYDLNQFISIWAPPSDGNNVDAYVQDIQSRMQIMTELSKKKEYLLFRLPEKPTVWLRISRQLYEQNKIA